MRDSHHNRPTRGRRAKRKRRCAERYGGRHARLLGEPLESRLLLATVDYIPGSGTLVFDTEGQTVDGFRITSESGRLTGLPAIFPLANRIVNSSDTNSEIQASYILTFPSSGFNGVHRFLVVMQPGLSCSFVGQDLSVFTTSISTESPGQALCAGAPPNQAPTDILLSSTSVDENAETKTIVGDFTAIDPDKGDEHEFFLVEGLDGPFDIVDGHLVVRDGSLLDFEETSTHEIVVGIVDSGGLGIERGFTISVRDVNESPTAILLPRTSIAENSPNETVVGTFEVNDPDAGELHELILEQNGNGRFEIVGTELRVANSFLLDHEWLNPITIGVIAVDRGGLTVESEFSINIEDVAEGTTGVGGEAARPAIISEFTSELSFTDVPDSVDNPFRYVGAPSGVITGDDRFWEITASTDDGEARLSTEIILDDEGNLRSGIEGDDFRLIGRTVIEGDSYDNVLLTAEVRQFGYTNTSLATVPSFDLRYVVTGGLLTTWPQRVYRVGEEIGLSITQTLRELSFPETFVVSSENGQGSITSTTTRTRDEGTTTSEHEPHVYDPDEDPPRDGRPPWIIGEELDCCPIVYADSPGVNEATGAPTNTSIDSHVSDRSGSFVHERTYRGDIVHDGPMGHNWEFSYNERLEIVTPQNLVEVRVTFPDAKLDDVVHHNGRGRSDVYRKDGNSFISPAGYFTRLQPNASGGFDEYHRDGRVVSYTPPGKDGIAKLGSTRDRNDNTMTFHYNEYGQLVHVVDDMGRNFDYFYTANGHIDRFKDFKGRVTQYGYDARGNLISVSTPAVENTPTGNDFPKGKTRHYAYTDAGQLLTITAPNEVASSGPARVRYQYETDPTSPSFGSVTALTYGGTNASQVPAGGTIQYQYESLSPADPTKLDAAVRRTTVTDRKGFQTTFDFNRLNSRLQSSESTSGLRPGDPAAYVNNNKFDGDYQVTEVARPEGNKFTLDYPDEQADHLQQGNVLSIRQLPGGRGGDQDEIVTSFTYEPIYNQIRTITYARGNDDQYDPFVEVPGLSNEERYTVTYFFDYQEHEDYAALAAKVGRTENEVRQLLVAAGVPMDMGNLNDDDSSISQVAGNVVKVQSPTVHLLSGSNQAQTGSTEQEIVTRYWYNEFGQLIREIDPEGNVDVYEYYPETDPDGDGQASPEPIDHRPLHVETGGYLRQVMRDVANTPGRNSGYATEPTFVRTQYRYDRVGNVIEEIDGRGIATRYFVNELDQTVQVTRAAAHNAFLPEEPPVDVNPPEPMSLHDFSYIERFYFDWNNNLVRHQVEDRGNTSDVGIWGDVNNDDRIGATDVDLLFASFGQPPEPRLNLFPDSEIDARDLDVLIQNVVGAIGGDADLDGEIDAADLNRLALNWRKNGDATWSDGDFNGDGNVDATDLNLLALNWRVEYEIHRPVAMADYEYRYDILDSRIEERQELNQGHLLTTRYRYDANGNQVLTVFPEGNANSSVYDERDLLFRSTRGALEPEPALFDGKPTILSASHNLTDSMQSWIPGELIGKPIWIVGGEGAGQLRTIVSNTATELRVDRSWEVRPDETSEYEIAPRVLMAPNDPRDFNVRGGAPCQCTTYRYDQNRNVIEMIDSDDTDLSPDNNSDVGLGPGDRTRYIYDGFDRLTSTVDGVGNQSVTQYDPDGNVMRELSFGPVGGRSPVSDGGDLRFPVSSMGVIQEANLVLSRPSRQDGLLAATEYHHDELDRVFQTDQVLFVNTSPTTRAPDVKDGAEDLGKANLTSGEGDNQAITGVTIFGRVTSRTDYDRNSRQTYRIEDDGDTSQTFYDGLDRVIKTVDPEGNLVEIAYDDNSNVIEVQETDVSQIDGIAPEVFVTTSFYDSLNRVEQTTDNIGQTIYYRYDSRHNLVATADAQGPLTGQSITRREFAGGALTVNQINAFGNVVLHYYDGISRELYAETILTASGEGDGINIGANIEGSKNFASAPAPPIPAPDQTQGGGDGIIRVGTVYDDNSLVSALIDDNGNVTLQLYDNLNRMVAATYGLTTASSLDLDVFSRDNILGQREIPAPTVATIDNPAVFPHDRLQEQIGDARDRVLLVLPLFHSLANRVDDHPPTTEVYGYSPDDLILIRETQNDAEVYTSYDAIGRATEVRVFPGGPALAGDPANPANPSVEVGTTLQTFEYDGLSRLTLATDKNEPLNTDDDSLVTRSYDSLSRVIEERQQIGALAPKVVSSGWRSSNLRSSLIYPDDRTLVTTYDDLDRIDSTYDLVASDTSTGGNSVDTLNDTSQSWQPDQWAGHVIRIVDGTGVGQFRTVVGNTSSKLVVDADWTKVPDGSSDYQILDMITDYDYIGSQRVLERRHGNGTRQTYLDDTGTTYDGLRRPEKLQHLRTDNSLVVGFTHTYDRMNNKLTEEKLHDSDSSELYRYDSTYRLTDFQRGTLNEAHDAIVTADSHPHSVQRQEWSLDGVGNWDQVITTKDNDAKIETREHSSINELVRRDNDQDSELIYDDNGNLIRMEDDASSDLIYEWDYASRLRAVYRSTESGVRELVATYFYDAFGRRTRKAVSNSGELDGVMDYYYDGWRVIDERQTELFGTDSPDPVAQEYIYGRYIDEPLALIRASGDRYYFHQNTIFSVFALTDQDGVVAEAYQYNAYGTQTVFTKDVKGNVEFDESGEDGIPSELGNPYLYTGRRLDSETALHHYRLRYLNHQLGRFISRDPIGPNGSLGLYEYVGSQPATAVDPSGLTASYFYLEGDFMDDDWPSGPEHLAFWIDKVEAKCDNRGDLTLVTYPKLYGQSVAGVRDLSTPAAVRTNRMCGEVVFNRSFFWNSKRAGGLSLLGAVLGGAAIGVSRGRNWGAAGVGALGGAVAWTAIYLWDENNMSASAQFTLSICCNCCPGPDYVPVLVSKDINRKARTDDGYLSGEWAVMECKGEKPSRQKYEFNTRF